MFSRPDLRIFPKTILMFDVANNLPAMEKQNRPPKKRSQPCVTPKRLTTRHTVYRYCSICADPPPYTAVRIHPPLTSPVPAAGRAAFFVLADVATVPFFRHFPPGRHAFQVPNEALTRPKKTGLLYLLPGMYKCALFCTSAFFSLPAPGRFSCSRLRGTQGARQNTTAQVWALAEVRGTCSGVPSRESWQVTTGSVSDHPEPNWRMEIPKRLFEFSNFQFSNFRVIRQI